MSVCLCLCVCVGVNVVCVPDCIKYLFFKVLDEAPSIAAPSYTSTPTAASTPTAMAMSIVSGLGPSVGSCSGAGAVAGAGAGESAGTASAVGAVPAGAVRWLRLLFSPRGLNLRNIVWHGFTSPTEQVENCVNIFRSYNSNGRQL